MQKALGCTQRNLVGTKAEGVAYRKSCSCRIAAFYNNDGARFGLYLFTMSPSIISGEGQVSCLSELKNAFDGGQVGHESLRSLVDTKISPVIHRTTLLAEDPVLLRDFRFTFITALGFVRVFYPETYTELLTVV